MNCVLLFEIFFLHYSDPTLHHFHDHILSALYSKSIQMIKLTLCCFKTSEQLSFLFFFHRHFCSQCFMDFTVRFDFVGQFCFCEAMLTTPLVKILTIIIILICQKSVRILIQQYCDRFQTKDISHFLQPRNTDQ